MGIKVIEGEKLRDCAVCGKPVVRRRYQDDSARTCRPGCAKELAYKEHPDLDSKQTLNRFVNGS